MSWAPATDWSVPRPSGPRDADVLSRDAWLFYIATWTAQVVTVVALAVWEAKLLLRRRISAEESVRISAEDSGRKKLRPPNTGKNVLTPELHPSSRPKVNRRTCEELFLSSPEQEEDSPEVVSSPSPTYASPDMTLTRPPTTYPYASPDQVPRAVSPTRDGPCTSDRRTSPARVLSPSPAADPPSPPVEDCADHDDVLRTIPLRTSRGGRRGGDELVEDETGLACEPPFVLDKLARTRISGAGRGDEGGGRLRAAGGATTRTRGAAHKTKEVAKSARVVRYDWHMWKVVLAMFVFAEHSGLVAPNNWEEEQQQFRAALRTGGGGAGGPAVPSTSPINIQMEVQKRPERFPMGSLPLQVCVPYFMMISGALYSKATAGLLSALLRLSLFFLVGVTLNMISAYLLDPAELVERPDGSTILIRYREKRTFLENLLCIGESVYHMSFILFLSVFYVVFAPLKQLPMPENVFLCAAAQVERPHVAERAKKDRHKFWLWASLNLVVSGIGLLVMLLLGISVGAYAEPVYSRLSSAEKLGAQFSGGEAAVIFMLASQPLGGLAMLVLYEVVLAWCYAASNSKRAASGRAASGVDVDQEESARPVNEKTKLLLKAFSPDHKNDHSEHEESPLGRGETVEGGISPADNNCRSNSTDHSPAASSVIWLLVFTQLFVVRVALPYENAVFCNLCLVFLFAMYAQRRPVTHKVRLQTGLRSCWILIFGVLLLISFPNASQQRPDIHPFRAFSERFRWYFVDLILVAAFLLDVFETTEDAFQSPRLWACLNYFSLLLYLTHVCVCRLMTLLPAQNISKAIPMWVLSWAYFFGLLAICWGAAFGCWGKLLGVFGCMGVPRSRRREKGAQKAGDGLLGEEVNPREEI